MSRFRIPHPRLAIALLTVLILLVAARAALPRFVKRFVNEKLQGLNGYTGRVDDVDLSLWRGAYQIKGLSIEKTGGKVPVPFLAADVIDLAVEWKALLHGSIVAELELYDPKLNFVNAKSPAQSQTKVDQSWTDTVRGLVPFEINRVALHGGQVHYRDLEADPRVDVFVQRLEATARNLTNSEKLGGNLYATVSATALAMGSGKVHFKGSVDPYAKQPTFDVSFQLDGLEIKQLNSFLKAYANVDAQEGTFSLDSQFSAHGGRFQGYAKPFIKNLKLLKWNEEQEGFFGKLWEGMVQVVGEIFTNHPKDQIATKVPFSGSIENPSADIWSTIGGILRNAFLQSLRRGIEGNMSLDGHSHLSKG
jgi:uncharacterized protein YhdP